MRITPSVEPFTSCWTGNRTKIEMAPNQPLEPTPPCCALRRGSTAR